MSTFRLTLLLSSVLFLSACGITSSPVDKDMVSRNSNVFIVDYPLHESLKIEDSPAVLNGLSFVSVALSNRTHREVSFQYRFYWFDQQGLEIDPEKSPWLTKTLQDTEKTEIKQAILNSNTDNYRLVLRLLSNGQP